MNDEDKITQATGRLAESIYELAECCNRKIEYKIRENGCLLELHLLDGADRSMASLGIATEVTDPDLLLYNTEFRNKVSLRILNDLINRSLN